MTSSKYKYGQFKPLAFVCHNRHCGHKNILISLDNILGTHIATIENSECIQRYFAGFIYVHPPDKSTKQYTYWVYDASKNTALPDATYRVWMVKRKVFYQIIEECEKQLNTLPVLPTKMDVDV